MSEDNEIVATFRALRATRKLKSVQMDKYLCRGSGCTLAVVFQVPERVVCWVPGYKNSSKLNDAVSVASAPRPLAARPSLRYEQRVGTLTASPGTHRRWQTGKWLRVTSERGTW